MPKERILIVDDEEDILELLRFNLTKEGYRVVCAASGEDGLKAVQEHKPDLIVLDLMLPGMDGLDMCRVIKGKPETSHIPIVMLTAKGEEPDVVTGLEMGADDYVVKPFSPRVLIARLRNIFRRLNQEPMPVGAVTVIGDIVIDPVRHEVKVAGKVIDLTATEFKILTFLAKRPGWVFSRDQIISGIRGQDYPVTERSVDVQVAGLRKKLGEAGVLLETVRGVGYRFKEYHVEET
jgi:two-component system phosphate regulon response regulator PhoB